VATGNIVALRKVRKVYIYRTCLLMEASDYNTCSYHEFFPRQKTAALQ
jgi:hypothetical protein